jgi:hypothetical protein
VSTGADLVVEGAVNFVCFGAEDGGEVVRHCDGIDGVRRLGVGGCEFALWMESVRRCRGASLAIVRF